MTFLSGLKVMSSHPVARACLEANERMGCKKRYSSIFVQILQYFLSHRVNCSTAGQFKR